MKKYIKKRSLKIIELKPAVLNCKHTRLVARDILFALGGYCTFNELYSEIRKLFRVHRTYLLSSLLVRDSGFVIDEEMIFLKNMKKQIRRKRL